MTNINADVLAINSVRGDEYFTLEKDVRIIADNLIPDLNIWCPFDTDADCPMCCDFCPVPDTSDVCKHEDRHELTYAERLDEGERFDVDEKDGM